MFYVYCVLILCDQNSDNMFIEITLYGEWNWKFWIATLRMHTLVHTWNWYHWISAYTCTSLGNGLVIITPIIQYKGKYGFLVLKFFTLFLKKSNCAQCLSVKYIIKCAH